jgi:hypothetical protein
MIDAKNNHRDGEKETSERHHAFQRPCPIRLLGFSVEQQRLSKMLDSMAGLVTGKRDALTRYTQPLTGSYYFVPSVESLLRLR